MNGCTLNWEGARGRVRFSNVQITKSCSYSSCGHGLHHLRFAPMIAVRPTFPLPLPAKRMHEAHPGPSFRRVQTSTFRLPSRRRALRPPQNVPLYILVWKSSAAQQRDIHPRHQRRNQLETFKTWEWYQRGSHGRTSRSHSTPRCLPFNSSKGAIACARFLPRRRSPWTLWGPAATWDG